MNDVKSILASKTVWSGLLALAGVLLNAFGYSFEATDQQAAIEAISNVMSTLGSIGAIYFRVKATKVIV